VVADNNASFTVRRRSTSPAASTFALSPLSSPCSSYHGDDLLGSPDARDDNPVENLAALYINDTVRSARSLGSNASSNRSSSSNGSAGSSSSSLTQQLPSFHRPLKFVSRPPDLPFAAVPHQGAGASPGRPGTASAQGKTQTARGAAIPRQRNRRNPPALFVEDADKAAFEQLVGGRRVRKSFLFGRKSASSRQAIDGILATSRPAADDDDKTAAAAELFWNDPPRLPPVDYAQTVSARSAEGWQMAARLNAAAVALLSRHDRRQGSRDAGQQQQQPSPPVSRDGKESPVDVEMSSKPPSRESSFRGDESDETGGASSAGTSDSATTAATQDESGSGGQQAPAPVKTEPNAGEPVGGGSGSRAGAPSTTTAATVDSKKRVYGCTVPDCGKVYTKSSHLKSHMRSHTGENERSL